jgi:hypothetical protein
MKKIFSLILQSLLTLVLINAQQPWQKISYPGTKELGVNFKTPPPEYGMILWWGWDGR